MPFDIDFLTWQKLYELMVGVLTNPGELIGLILVGFIAWNIYKAMKGTQAEQMLKGILIILIAFFISSHFNWIKISSFLESILQIILFGFVVIFQPELRRVLGYLGQPAMLTRNILNLNNSTEVAGEKLVASVTEAVKHLSKTHTGALIVIEDPNSSSETYLEVGTPLNADVSVELILTIFHPNTPLHDGAVVVSGDKILAAGVLLPLTEDPKLSWQYGTRHRAAIGMSEMSPSVCLVVSEETGEISMAKAGVLRKFAKIDELKKTLEDLLGVDANSDKKSDIDSKSLIQDILPGGISKL